MIITQQQRHQSISTARTNTRSQQWPVLELTSVQPITTPDSWLHKFYEYLQANKGAGYKEVLATANTYL